MSYAQEIPVSHMPPVHKRKPIAPHRLRSSIHDA